VLTIADARPLWEPEGPYLNTATYGLPPRPAWDALQAALSDWHHGRVPFEPWCEPTERSRELFGGLVGVPAERVTTGASASYLMSVVAASLPDGARVLVPEVDYSSVTWPLLVRGLCVRAVPLDRLADAVDASVDVVAFSAVQSSDGAVAALDDVVAAAQAHDVLTIVDATHAVGWLPLDASRFDAVVCAAYKWLLSPRGTAFMAVSERLLERTRPTAPNWYAADDRFGRYYDPELHLADDARRLDLSPAWFSWIGAEPALRVLSDVGVEQIHAHNVALADRFCAGLGLPTGPSALVSTSVPGAEEKLARAGVRAATRAGSLRASFHLYNTEGDVDTALSALLD